MFLSEKSVGNSIVRILRYRVMYGDLLSQSKVESWNFRCKKGDSVSNR